MNSYDHYFYRKIELYICLYLITLTIRLSNFLIYLYHPVEVL